MSGTEPSRNSANTAMPDPSKDLWADLFLERLAPDTKASLTPAQLAAVDAHAQASGQSRDQVVGAALEQYLAARE